MIIDGAVLLTFMISASAVVLSPGPDTVLILKYALSSGRKTGLAAVLGVQIGLCAHTLFAVLGISLIIANNPLLFQAVALAGAFYLAWLAVQGIKNPLMKLDVEGKKMGAAKALQQAFITNLLNPKVIILFFALLPNFIDPGRGDTSLQLVVLCSVLVVINVIWQVGLTWAADRARIWLSRENVQRALSYITSGFLLFFAVAMVWDNLL